MIVTLFAKAIIRSALGYLMDLKCFYHEVKLRNCDDNFSDNFNHLSSSEEKEKWMAFVSGPMNNGLVLWCWVGEGVKGKELVLSTVLIKLNLCIFLDCAFNTYKEDHYRVEKCDVTLPW